MHWFRSVVLVLVLASVDCLSAAIDLEAAVRPDHIRIVDRRIERRFGNLFQPTVSDIDRQVFSIANEAGDQGLTLLVARLWYNGGPWDRSPADRHSGDEAWERSSNRIREAILRELRWHSDPDLAAALAIYLRQERHPDLVRSALICLLAQDAAIAVACADALARPQADNQWLGAKTPAVRHVALVFLTEQLGVDHASCTGAWRWTLLESYGVERVRALHLLPRGERQQLLEQSLALILRDLGHDNTDPQNRLALALATSRLQRLGDHESDVRLQELVLNGDRALATAAATALARRSGPGRSIDPEAIAQRAASTDDPALRTALTGLLIQIDPTSIEFAEDHDPAWRILARHRRSLADRTRPAPPP